MSTAKWLKYYVYLRQIPNDKSKKVSIFKPAMITFLVSAVWHGFYPGYYIFFIELGLVDYISKLYGNILNPLVEGKLPGPLIYVIAWLWCFAWFSYINICFFLLSFENTHKVHGSMNYIGEIILVVSMAVLYLINPKEKKSSVSEKTKDVKVE